MKKIAISLVAAAAAFSCATAFAHTAAPVEKKEEELKVVVAPEKAGTTAEKSATAGKTEASK